MSLPEIRQKIEKACKDAKRPASSVTLVAVSKNQPPEKIAQAIAEGQRVFGENRVQEAQDHWNTLRAQHADLQLHFIGHLQTNKAKEAIKLFDVIETVDSERLADALKNEMEKQKRSLPCFLQVNTGEEPQKGGIAPRELEKLVRFCREEAKMDLRGLMCIPPENETPDMHFALLHKLGREFSLPSLSMGMSADFEIAIRYGSSHVRVGSALFGFRENNKSV